MNESKNDKSVEFLCSTKIGKILLEFILFIRIPKLIGFFLRSPLSHFMISRFIKKNEIDIILAIDYVDKVHGDAFLLEQPLNG